MPVFFMGAQFCPYCGAERWALVNALERFGTLTGFGKDMSNDGIDGYKPVVTYDLRNATYTSQYISFSDKEVQDHNFKPLQKLDPTEEAYINKYDPRGGWPFTIINGQYAALGNAYSPKLFEGANFDTIRQQLMAGTHNQITDAITREASLITRYLCASTGGQPADVCKG